MVQEQDFADLLKDPNCETSMALQVEQEQREGVVLLAPWMGHKAKQAEEVELLVLMVLERSRMDHDLFELVLR